MTPPWTWKWQSDLSTVCQELPVRLCSRGRVTVIEFRTDANKWERLPGTTEFDLLTQAKRYADEHPADLIQAVPRSTVPRHLLIWRDLRDTVDQLDEVIESTRARTAQDPLASPHEALDANGRPLLGDMLAAKANALAALARLATPGGHP